MTIDLIREDMDLQLKENNIGIIIEKALPIIKTDKNNLIGGRQS